MGNAGSSFSQSSNPQDKVICNSGKGSAFDVAALLSAIGGENLQYIEFNSVRREHETRQRWPLLGRVSELLDKPDNVTGIPKPVVLYGDGASI